MKKRILLAAAALALSLSLPALAAEEPAIQVQLDGQNLTFTDAVPQVKDQRTFLPFRAVFEAMGAEVAYEGEVITATRGDTTLTLTIGSTEATVVTGENTRTLAMDVAPYVDNTTWRTYVPVRFAANAFGCNVGWDQENLTAVIVDVEPLVAQTLEGKNFTILDRYLEYSRKYNEGNHAVDLTMTGKGTLMGADVLTLDGSITGTVTGTSAGEMNAQVTMDMTGLMNLMAALSGTTPEEMDAAPEEYIIPMGMDMKIDLERGNYFFRYDEATSAQAGLPANTWISMDLGATLGEMGLDLEALTNMDLKALMGTMATAYPLDDQAAAGYTDLVSMLTGLTDLLCDDSFEKTEEGYVLNLEFTQPELTFNGSMVLACDETDTINGYALDLNCVIPLDAATQAQVAEMGLTMESVTMVLTASLDENDQCTMAFVLSAGDLLVVDLGMDYAYELTDTPADPTLPAGSEVIDYQDFLMQSAQIETESEITTLEE